MMLERSSLMLWNKIVENCKHKENNDYYFVKENWQVMIIEKICCVMNLMLENMPGDTKMWQLLNNPSFRKMNPHIDICVVFDFTKLIKVRWDWKYSWKS